MLVVNDCPALREVVNNSRLSCKIPGYKKYVTWKVGKKETRVIPPGKTGKSIGKKIPIRLDLMKKKAVGKLPKSYRFGEEVKLPDCVKRDGYVFMGWSTSMYEEDRLELEGGHIMNGNKYEFLAVKEVEEEGKDGKVERSRHVFLTSIDLLDIKTQVK